MCQEMIAACEKDIGRGGFLAEVIEVRMMQDTINDHIAHLKEWMEPTSVDVPVAAAPAKAYIQYEPVGVVLILGTWNFPF